MVEEDKNESSELIIPENFTISKSSEESGLSSTLIYHNVAEAYINDNGIFTTAASTSTARLRSLEQGSEDIPIIGHNIRAHHDDESPQKYNFIDM